MAITSINKTKYYTYALWQIDESLEDLLSQLKGTKEELKQIHEITHLKRKKQNISARLILNHLSKKKVKLNYLNTGAPCCKQFKHISISHSKNYCAVITSHHEIGIDIQYQKKNITRLHPKFINKTESKSLQNQYTKKDLHLIWCAKEAIYKTLNNPLCSLKDDIYIINLENKTMAYYNDQNNNRIKYIIDYQTLGNYFIAIATKNHD